uniref:Ycf21 n=1 Tax=Anunuuluaehu liula TaxID=3049639 RepID=UPI0030036A60
MINNWIIMSINIHLTYKFHKILFLPINNTNYNLSHLIPIEWQLILISDGSFTQNLNSLTGKHIKIEIISPYSKTRMKKKKMQTREVWIKDHKDNKLAFAKSLWPAINKTNYFVLPQNQSIGQSLIELQIDMYKDIHEIYYGYCRYLENKFHDNGPTWGRKYTLFYQKQRLATVQEIFSPQIINFFHSKKQ